MVRERLSCRGLKWVRKAGGVYGELACMMEWRGRGVGERAVVCERESKWLTIGVGEREGYGHKGRRLVRGLERCGYGMGDGWSVCVWAWKRAEMDESLVQ
ncbi:unnamed protein product [Dovyalis caffra]|uniref:Uncharacterized protein n=1 Tax=Dovyalis caffra TaxID=77055 RepID=A0AAV1SQ62_9ROSI|nr:unnamed protein product [Dovyalis caffra]